MAASQMENRDSRQGRLTLIVSLALSGLVGYLAVIWATQPSSSVSIPRPEYLVAPKTLLVADKPDIDFGIVEPGALVEDIVCLKNPSEQVVEIDEVKTSCNCFQVFVEPRILPPGQKVKATVRVDFGDEPSFHGRLALEAHAVAKGREGLALLIKAKVTVGQSR